MTFEEKYGPVMEATTKAEAKEQFERCVQHSMSLGMSREDAMALEKKNIGYIAGYYSEETAKRVWDLYECHHPFFGTDFPNGAEAVLRGIIEAKKEKP